MPNEIEAKQTVFVPDPDINVDLGKDSLGKIGYHFLILLYCFVKTLRFE